MKRQHLMNAIRSLAECMKLSKSRDEVKTYMGLIAIMKELLNEKEDY